jgi:hypothetical protein
MLGFILFLSFVLAVVAAERSQWPNVGDHRWLAVARLLPKRSEAEPAGGVTRVAIRWIALFDVFLF